MSSYERTERYRKPKDLTEFLALAIEREETSIGFYKDMRMHNFAAEIKELIDKLINEESGHKESLENKLKDKKNA